jgi:hypothetical protein
VRFPWAKAAAVGVTAASVGAAAWIATACIPDLVTRELPPIPPAPLCGNGFIDRDAGEACDPGASGEAGVLGCTSACAVTCGDGGLVDPATGHCYFVASVEEKTYATASSDCYAQSAHPVTFASAREFQLVAAWAPAQLPGFWVGFNRLVGTSQYTADSPSDEPGWVAATCAGCFAETDPSGTLFHSALFDAGTATNCVVAPYVKATGDTPWAQWPCSAIGAGPRTVCEREPVGTSTTACNGAFCVDLAFTHGTKSYLFFAQPTTADLAEAQCEDFPGGVLVTLESAEEREELWGEIATTDSTVTQIWIGLALDADAGGAWTWSDGTPLRADGGHPIPWGDKQPVDAGASRAYLQRLPTQDVVDNQLAQNFNHTPPSAGGAVPTMLPFVCQISPATDAGGE